MKICNTCGKTKTLDQFHYRAASKDGLSYKCKSCQKDYDKARANAPHRVKARKEYMKEERGKEAHNRATKKWIERNLKKRKAHVITGNAIRDGKIVRSKTCEECDCTINLEAHHDDYDKPLEVIWLCQACHNKWHAENGEGKNAH